MVKVGNRVTIKTPEEIRNTEEVNEYENFFVKKNSSVVFVKGVMERFIDKSFTIKEITKHNKIILEGNNWYWGDWMIKSLNKQLELF